MQLTSVSNIPSTTKNSGDSADNPQTNGKYIDMNMEVDEASKDARTDDKTALNATTGPAENPNPESDTRSGLLFGKLAMNIDKSGSDFSMDYLSANDSSRSPVAAVQECSNDSTADCQSTSSSSDSSSDNNETSCNISNVNNSMQMDCDGTSMSEKTPTPAQCSPSSIEHKVSEGLEDMNYDTDGANIHTKQVKSADLMDTSIKEEKLNNPSALNCTADDVIKHSVAETNGKIVDDDMDSHEPHTNSTLKEEISENIPDAPEALSSGSNDATDSSLDGAVTATATDREADSRFKIEASLKLLGNSDTPVITDKKDDSTISSSTRQLETDKEKSPTSTGDAANTSDVVDMVDVTNTSDVVDMVDDKERASTSSGDITKTPDVVDVVDGDKEETPTSAEIRTNAPDVVDAAGDDIEKMPTSTQNITKTPDVVDVIDDKEKESTSSGDITNTPDVVDVVDGDKGETPTSTQIRTNTPDVVDAAGDDKEKTTTSIHLSTSLSTTDSTTDVSTQSSQPSSSSADNSALALPSISKARDSPAPVGSQTEAPSSGDASAAAKHKQVITLRVDGTLESSSIRPVKSLLQPLQAAAASKPAKVEKLTLTKNSFNLKPPSTDLITTGGHDAPTPQDIKDGHAYLRPMPKFLYQLGLSLLREVVYEGLAEHVGGLRKKGDKKYSAEQYQSLQKSLVNLKKDNSHLKMTMDKTCPGEMDGKPCGFRTESMLALETHMSEAHINANNRFVCVRCDSHFSTPLQNIFKNHMMDKHGHLAFTTKGTAFFQCKLCFYDTNTNRHIQSHMISCGRTFDIAKNLKPDGQSNTPLGEAMFKIVQRPVAPPRVPAPLPFSMIKKPPATVTLLPTTTAIGTGTLRQIKVNSEVILPAPQRPVMPTQISTSVTQIGGKAIGTEVVPCEICGGYIQGTQALRVHMQWCHNMNITHLKGPGFTCANEYCSKTFWTVQGLAKHTTTCASVAHYVAVPDDKASCFLCRKPYQSSQVEHLLAKHLNDLKKMVELTKCLAVKCLPFNFGSVENLQAHLAKVHRLKMTGLSGLATASVGNIKFQPFCSICKLKFESSTDFAKHCAKIHVHKCDLCGAQCSTKQGLKEHESVVHPYRFCLACNKQIKRSHYERHLKSMHNADTCQVPLKRISTEEYDMYIKKPKLANWS